MRNKYLAAALPATLALVLAAVYLPEQISRYQDRQLLDVPHIVREAEDRGELADSLRLAVPEKLMLLQEGKLNFLPLTDESVSGLRFALVDGEVKSVGQVRGKVKALNYALDFANQYPVDSRHTVMFGHSRCLETMELYRDKVVQALGIQDYDSDELGAVIGVHAGPGCYGMAYIGLH